MEKKMKERQRLFRKQQLHVEEPKAYQQQAVAATSAQHELGDVLISHNSSHDSKQETTYTVLESVKESAEKNIGEELEEMEEALSSSHSNDSSDKESDGDKETGEDSLPSP